MIDIEVKRPKLVEFYLRNICKTEAFICGGFARVACSPRDNPIPSKDIDIYCLELSHFDEVAKRIEALNYIKVKENDVSHIYRYALDSRDTMLEINLIKPLQTGHLHTFGDLDTILSNFDFTIARIGTYLQDDIIKARGDEEFIDNERDNVLIIKNIHCPIAEVTRIAKYIQKGYKCPLGQILRCFLDWDDRDGEFRRFLVANLMEKKELTTEDTQELYKRLYID
jgi:hypothetical protein